MCFGRQWVRRLPRCLDAKRLSPVELLMDARLKSVKDSLVIVQRTGNFTPGQQESLFKHAIGELRQIVAADPLLIPEAAEVAQEWYLHLREVMPDGWKLPNIHLNDG